MTLDPTRPFDPPEFTTSSSPDAEGPTKIQYVLGLRVLRDWTAAKLSEIAEAVNARDNATAMAKLTARVDGAYLAAQAHNEAILKLEAVAHVPLDFSMLHARLVRLEALGHVERAPEATTAEVPHAPVTMDPGDVAASPAPLGEGQGSRPGREPAPSRDSGQAHGPGPAHAERDVTPPPLPDLVEAVRIQIANNFMDGLDVAARKALDVVRSRMEPTDEDVETFGAFYLDSAPRDSELDLDAVRVALSNFVARRFKA